MEGLRPCTCGCGLLLPELHGELDGHAWDAVFLHGKQKEHRALFLAAHLSGRSVAFRVSVNLSGKPNWLPAFPSEIPPGATLTVPEPIAEPPKYEGVPGAVETAMKLLEAVLAQSDDCVDHLYGFQGEEQDLEMNFLPPPVPGAQRAIIAVPIVGGADLQIGAWFDARGNALTPFTLSAHPVLGVNAVIASHGGVLQVDAWGTPKLQAVTKTVHLHAQLAALKRELHDAAMQIEVARVLPRN